jgi:hypothetical protein
MKYLKKFTTELKDEIEDIFLSIFEESFNMDDHEEEFWFSRKSYNIMENNTFDKQYYQINIGSGTDLINLEMFKMYFNRFKDRLKKLKGLDCIYLPLYITDKLYNGKSIETAMNILIKIK